MPEKEGGERGRRGSSPCPPFPFPQFQQPSIPSEDSTFYLGLERERLERLDELVSYQPILGVPE